MKWLELIKLQSSAKSSGLLEKFLLPMARVSQSGLVEIKTSRHAVLGTGLSVHLHWESDRAEQNGSTVGLSLARALKEFGLIDHSIWLEEEK